MKSSVMKKEGRLQNPKQGRKEMYMGIATDGRLASGHGRRTDGGQIAQKNLDPGGVAPSGSKNPICACLEFKMDRLKWRPRPTHPFFHLFLFLTFQGPKAEC